MMDLHECVICGASIWPVTLGELCFAHNRPFSKLRRRVERAERTDWTVGQSHTERQCARDHYPQPWQPKFDDIMRQAMHWLASGDESEAA